MIEHETFTFDEEPASDLAIAVIAPDRLVAGFASFDEDHYWEYEHSRFVVIPEDLSPYGVDAAGGEAIALFEEGTISYDTWTRRFVYAEDEEPAMGGRYVCFGEGFWLGERFELDGGETVFQMLGD